MTRLDHAAQWGLIGAGCLTAAAALASGGPAFLRPIQLAAGMAITAAGAYVLGARRACEQVTAGFRNATAHLPASITFHRGDDGELHALVTTVGGDVRTIDVPADQAETPNDAASYIVDLLTAEVDEQ